MTTKERRKYPYTPVKDVAQVSGKTVLAEKSPPWIESKRVLEHFGGVV